MTEDRTTLTALLIRLKECHPRHQAELQTLAYLLEKSEITDEVFDQTLKQLRAVTHRLLH
jgi:hypothetical protein